jgi:hypothetical protein
VACDADQADDRAAQGGEDLGQRTAVHLGSILPKGDIAYPGLPILDGPVLADEVEQLGRAGALGGAAMGALPFARLVYTCSAERSACRLYPLDN